MAGPMTEAKVNFNYAARSANEITVNAGEYLRVISKHNEWWYVESKTAPGKKGMVPASFLTELVAGATPRVLSNTPSVTQMSRQVVQPAAATTNTAVPASQSITVVPRGSIGPVSGAAAAAAAAGNKTEKFRAKALYDYSRKTDAELSFKEGDELPILEDNIPGGWWLAESNGQMGHVPSGFFQKVVKAPPTGRRPSNATKRPPPPGMTGSPMQPVTSVTPGSSPRPESLSKATAPTSFITQQTVPATVIGAPGMVPMTMQPMMTVVPNIGVMPTAAMVQAPMVVTQQPASATRTKEEAHSWWDKHLPVGAVSQPNKPAGQGTIGAATKPGPTAVQAGGSLSRRPVQAIPGNPWPIQATPAAMIAPTTGLGLGGAGMMAVIPPPVATPPSFGSAEKWTARVMFDYVAMKEGELEAKQGDIVTVIGPETSGWCLVESEGGRQGHLPKTWLEPKMSSPSASMGSLGESIPPPSSFSDIPPPPSPQTETAAPAVKISAVPPIRVEVGLSIPPPAADILPPPVTSKTALDIPPPPLSMDDGPLPELPKTSITTQKSVESVPPPPQELVAAVGDIMLEPPKVEHMSMEVDLPPLPIDTQKSTQPEPAKISVEKKVSPVAEPVHSASFEERALVLYEFQPVDTTQIKIEPGDIVVILEKTESWYRGRDQSGAEGYFPATYVQLLKDPQGCPKFVGLYDFEGESKSHLSFKAGAVLRVVCQDETEWWKAELDGKYGLIPKAFVAPAPTQEEIKPEITIEKEPPLPEPTMEKSGSSIMLEDLPPPPADLGDLSSLVEASKGITPSVLANAVEPGPPPMVSPPTSLTTIQPPKAEPKVEPLPTATIVPPPLNLPPPAAIVEEEIDVPPPPAPPPAVILEPPVEKKPAPQPAKESPRPVMEITPVVEVKQPVEVKPPAVEVKQAVPKPPPPKQEEVILPPPPVEEKKITPPPSRQQSLAKPPPPASSGSINPPPPAVEGKPPARRTLPAPGTSPRTVKPPPPASSGSSASLAAPSPVPEPQNTQGTAQIMEALKALSSRVEALEGENASLRTQLAASLQQQKPSGEQPTGAAPPGLEAKVADLQRRVMQENSSRRDLEAMVVKLKADVETLQRQIKSSDGGAGQQDFKSALRKTGKDLTQ